MNLWTFFSSSAKQAAAIKMALCFVHLPLAAQDVQAAEGAGANFRPIGAEHFSHSVLSKESVKHTAPRQDGLRIGMFQQGQASYYADKFHGKRTASGDRFDMYAMTAAHKTLPFGTLVSVRNLHNGKSIKVQINDRGPFIAGRIIDVSKQAAEYLNMIGGGVAPVKIVILSLPRERMLTSRNPTKMRKKQAGSTTVPLSDQSSAEIPSQRRFAIQIASYSQLKYAKQRKQQLEHAGIPIHFEKHGKYHRLIIVNLNNEQVQHYHTELARLGIRNVLVRQE